MTEEKTNSILELNNAPNFKSVIEAARLYLMRWGFTLTPVERRSKKPLLKDWGNTIVTEETLPKIFSDDSLNIGVILGPRSGGLADVDLDCAEGRALAPYLLPKTGLIRGRESAPGSGYLYIVNDANVKYVETRDPSLPRNERNVLVELRTSSEGRAHMTVVPPSVHPSGERYVWNSFEEPARVSGEELIRAVHQMAAASLVVRYYQHGSRQDLILPLAGVLFRLNYDLDFSIHFVRSIATVAKDEQVGMRVDAVRSTYENAEHGHNVTGGPTLADVLGEKKLADRIVRYLKLGSIKPDDHNLSRAQQLNSLLSEVELFRTPQGKTFASLYVEGHRETWPIKSDGFESWVRYTFLEEYGQLLTTQSMANVISLMQAKAYRAPLRSVCTRVAEVEGLTYIDLGDPQWRAIRVSPGEWEIIEDPPNVFRRPDGLLPLPMPTPDGKIERLRAFLNIDSDKEWLMLVSCMAQAFSPRGPYPLLSLVGEQGSAKSTTARVIRQLIDPNVAELRMLPKHDKDLMVMANNSWLLVFDNISAVPDWLSNALCSLSTGGSFSTRALYTDDSEAMFTAKRPIILTSIAEVITRSDLLDRTVLINLPPILDERRRYEDEFWEEFAQIKGKVFGGLLNILCAAREFLPGIKLTGKPRMADFAKIGVAVEKALGMTPGLFISTYNEYRKYSVIQVLESSPVARAMMRLMAKEPEWSGTTTKLLERLQDYADTTEAREGWPQTARGLSNRLRELGPNLRRAGFIIEKERASHGGVVILKLKRVGGEVEVDPGSGPRELRL